MTEVNGIIYKSDGDSMYMCEMIIADKYVWHGHIQELEQLAFKPCRDLKHGYPSFSIGDIVYSSANPKREAVIREYDLGLNEYYIEFLDDARKFTWEDEWRMLHKTKEQKVFIDGPHQDLER